MTWTEEEQAIVEEALGAVIPMFLHNISGLDVYDGDAEQVAEKVFQHAVDVPLVHSPEARIDLARMWALKQIIAALRITADGIERMIMADDTKGNPSG